MSNDPNTPPQQEHEKETEHSQDAMDPQSGDEGIGPDEPEKLTNAGEM